MTKAYIVQSIDTNTYINFGFMTATRRSFSTLEEAENYIENNIKVWKEHNWTPHTYRIKNGETGEIIKEYLQAERKKK